MESWRGTEQSEKQAQDERVPLNWWVWNVFMLNTGHQRAAEALQLHLSASMSHSSSQKWNVNPRSPQFLPCQYLFDSCLALIYSATLSSLPRLFLLILSLSIPHFVHQLWLLSATCRCFPISAFSVSPESVADRCSLQPTEIRRAFIMLSSTNQSSFISVSLLFICFIF